MPRVTEIYAYITSDADEDDEGIPAFQSASGMWMPMVGADMERADQLREIAQEFADETGKRVKLIRSTGLEVVETLEPNGVDKVSEE